MKKFLTFSLFFVFLSISFGQVNFSPYFTAYGTDIQTINARVPGGTDGSYCRQFGFTGNSSANGLGAQVVDVEYRLSGFGTIVGVALRFDVQLGGMPVLPNGTISVALMSNGRQVTSRMIILDSLNELSWKTVSIPFLGSFDEVSFTVSGHDTASAQQAFFASVIINADNVVLQQDLSGNTEMLTSFESEDNPTAVDELIIPSDFYLGQNYPNPFNPTTKIIFAIAQAAHVNLVVYDITGRIVKILVGERLAARSHEVDFDASGLASGMYLYQLRVGSFTKTKKMILMK